MHIDSYEETFDKLKIGLKKLFSHWFVIWIIVFAVMALLAL